MTITAKFNSICPKCQHPIRAGAQVEWRRGEKAEHLTCPQNAPAPRVEPKADVVAIATFIGAARDRGLKFPKARFLAPDGRSEMLLSIASGRSSAPGAVNVKINGDYVGRVLPSGDVTGDLRGRQDVIETLVRIAENPAAAAKAYGALTCSCSFCGKALTDAGSVEVGYGPVCADKWNLPHKPKGTPELKAVVAQTYTPVAVDVIRQAFDEIANNSTVTVGGDRLVATPVYVQHPCGNKTLLDLIAGLEVAR